ncbi:MAG TPA: IS5 family transposase [Hyphomicrobiales bacterium]|nr:IS5 family transposase [Hyphomicrobiales bacterium]
MARHPGLFDVDDRLRRLSDIGDQLEAFATVVDFEMFRPELDAALAYSDGAKGGRPPFDPVMMFKILVIQAQNNLSDDRAEFLINDRLSFMRFLRLGLADRVPDAKTIWAFRERLTRAGAIEALFRRFDRAIREAGYIPMSGQIVDASLVAAPKQRNTEAEKADIKAGRIPDAWQHKPAKLRQKDRDARWTLVFGRAREREDGTRHADIAIPVFGYKSHASIDRRHGFIRRWDVSDAAAHDGRMLRRGLLDRSNTGATVWADSAYRSKANEAFMQQHGFRSQVHHRKPRGRPMAPHIRRGNASRSRVRAGIEHVFAQQKGPMELCIRTIGMARAKAKIGLANLTYNIRRMVWLERRCGCA